MSDSTLEWRDTDSASTEHEARTADTRESRTTDLEKRGRSVEPFDALLEARKRPEQINVGREERILSILSGGALIAYGLSRGSWSGIALALAGGGLAARGITGTCPVYAATNVNTAAGDSRESNGVHVEQAISIDKPAEDLYSFWRDFGNHALLSDYLTSVTVTGEKLSHWIAKGPANKPLEWDAEIINDVPNELIAWKTLPGADIAHAGSVRFKPAPAMRGTEVHITMQYYPPAGTLGAGVALLFHREPSIQTADMLKRLKRLMETGEIVKVDGQPHGQSLVRTAVHPKS